MFKVGDLVKIKDNLQPQQKVYSGMVGVIAGVSTTNVRIRLLERCVKKIREINESPKGPGWTTNPYISLMNLEEFRVDNVLITE